MESQVTQYIIAPATGLPGATDGWIVSLQAEFIMIKFHHTGCNTPVQF